MKIHISQPTIGSPNIPWPPRACVGSMLVGASVAAAADEGCCITGSDDGGRLVTE